MKLVLQNLGKIFWLKPVYALEKSLNVGFEVLDSLEENIPLKTGKQYFEVVLEKKYSVGLFRKGHCWKMMQTLHTPT